MILPMMTVGLSQHLIVPQASYGVFNLDTMAGKSLVELFVVRRSFPASGLAAWGGT